MGYLLGMQEPMLFAGNAHPALARAIAEELGTTVASATVSTFRDGETQVVVHDDVRGRDVFVVQPTSPPVNNNLMELFVLLDAMRRAGAARRVAVVPYYGYGRQERRATPQEPISARLVADLLVASGVDQIITMDLTAAAIEGFFDLPVEHLHATAVLAGAFAVADAGRLAVVAPDIGAVKRAEAFQRLIAPGASLVVVIKERPRPDEVRAGAVVGEVHDRHAILVDDIISTGGTMVRAAEAVLQRGALSVSACATHAVLAPGAQEALESSPLQRVVVTDTIPAASKGKLEVVSVARLFAEAIARIHGEPLMERAVVME